MGLSFNFQLPLWNPNNFTMNNNFWSPNMFNGFQMPIWQAPASSVSTPDSYEEWIKEKYKESENTQTNIEFIREKSKEISKTRDLITEQSKMIETIKEGKKSDGSSIVESAKLEGVKLKEDGTVDTEAMKPKKKGFWQKAGEWAASAGTALANMGKSLAGYDKDGKFSLKKCLTNVAITAAAIGACFIPFAGPAIGYGLLAYGIGSGAVGVYKGAKKLNNAATEEEKEQARQDICSGAFVGIASAAGMRGLGKAFRTSGASTASTSASIGGRVTRAVSNFTKDMTVNAVKGTAQAMKTDAALITAKGGGTSGFFKAWKNKAVNAWENFNSWEKRYENKYSQMEKSTQQRITELNRQIKNTNRADRTTLKNLWNERKALVKQRKALQKFKNIKSKAELDVLKETYSKDFKELIELRECVMRVKAAKPDKYASELSDYIPSPNVEKHWWKPATWRKNEYQLAIGGKNPGKYGELTRIALTSPASPTPLTLAQWQREFSVPLLGSAIIDMTPEQTEAYLNQLEQEKKQLEDALKTLNDIKDISQWNQLKAQAKAQQEAAALQQAAAQ